MEVDVDGLKLEQKIVKSKLTSPDGQDADGVDDCHDKNEGASSYSDDKPYMVAPSSSRSVKSTAVVRYESVRIPARFHELQPETNLNKPPSNWLHGQCKWAPYMRNASIGHEHAFSSFKMAHCFPDLAGEVDAISDAAIMKKLLKIPYSKSHVSVMVHRVGNTLLLDEFDIHRHLLRKQQNDWGWLRNFYYNTIVQNLRESLRDKCVLKKNNTRDYHQSRNMFSKFLHYSVSGVSDDDEDATNDTEPDTSQASSDDVSSNSVHSVHVATLGVPDPLPLTPEESEHQRTVLWNFEDNHMLIGANLPIFGGGKYPCVSLRLRDMQNPISVLTGLDYWLDNLMCNVPELVMCYHLNGIVQRYELIKTEDIPNLKDSKFSPQVVKDIAQNILSFLKASATKEGHTYWLFKGHDDDVVKLYDLTTLCDTDDTASSRDNPFTVPVGILLYRVACNMRQANARRNNAATIRTLLKNCLLLLDHDLHPQVVTSAHYMLSDLYVSDHISRRPLTGTDGEQTSDDDDESVIDQSELSEEQFEPPPLEMTDTAEGASSASSSVDVQALCVAESVQKSKSEKRLVRYPPIGTDMDERCNEALKHIAQGLTCLQHSEARSKPSKHTVDDLTECNPHKPIPMHYEPLRGVTPSSDSQVSMRFRDQPPGQTWQHRSRILLLRKSSLTYMRLAQLRAASTKYGQALRYARYAHACLDAVKSLSTSGDLQVVLLESALYGLSADLHVMLAQNLCSYEAHMEDFLYQREDNQLIWEHVIHVINDEDSIWVRELMSDPERNLEKSLQSYRRAIDLAHVAPPCDEHVKSLQKRCGNVENELGVFYMNQAVSKLSEQGISCSVEAIQQIWSRSQACFDRGIEIFEQLEDTTNTALLLSNSGRLMRVFGQACVQYEAGHRGQFSHRERVAYHKAQQCYQRALDLLTKTDKHSRLWHSVSWELCSTYFTMATLLQDFAPLATVDQQTVEKEVTELMTKALTYCEDSSASSSVFSSPTYQYRAATIHHRLASLYHNSYREQCGDQKRKHLRCLAELHYGKACRLFVLLDTPCEVLRVQLERVAMCEYQLTGKVSSSSKVKILQGALECLLQTAGPLSSIHRQVLESSDSETNEFDGYRDEADKLLAIAESRLQFVLLNLVKNVSALAAKKSRVSDVKLISAYRDMYAASLTSSKTDTDLATRCQHLTDTLREVETVYRQLVPTAVVCTTFNPG